MFVIQYNIFLSIFLKLFLKSHVKSWNAVCLPPKKVHILQFDTFITAATYSLLRCQDRVAPVSLDHISCMVWSGIIRSNVYDGESIWCMTWYIFFLHWMIEPKSNVWSRRWIEFFHVEGSPLQYNCRLTHSPTHTLTHARCTDDWMILYTAVASPWPHRVNFNF